MADGLKKRRSGSGKVPTFECPNCKCKRYSKCGCMKAAGIMEDDPNLPAPEAPAETAE